MLGQVIEKTQGFYNVEAENSKIYTLKIRGTLKKKREKTNCVIGDKVSFDENELVITEIFKRKNLLLRPLIANVDICLMIATIKEPKFDFISFQKNLLCLNEQGIKAALVINKIDILEKNEIEEFIQKLRKLSCNIPLYFISIKKNLGDIEKLKEYMQNKLIVLSGQSGVGKSSFVNYILEKDYLTVGELARKTKKGKNTTIITRFFEKNNIRIFDTPGYSMIIEPNFENVRDIMYHISEFKNYIGKCKYRDCLHLKEPDCAVKKAVEENQISTQRYEFYNSICKRSLENERN